MGICCNFVDLLFFVRFGYLCICNVFLKIYYKYLSYLWYYKY